jgi:hypothetical protein
MIVLRCTQRLLKASGIKPVEEPPAPTAPLGEWYANIVSLPFRGRSLVVFVDGGTLLSVVAPGRVVGTTVPVFQRRLPHLLKRLDMPQAWIDEHMAGLSEVCFARTASRSVLGSMNDIARQIWGDAESVRSFDQLDLDWLEARLGEVPFGALRYRSPIGALAELVQPGSCT